MIYNRKQITDSHKGHLSLVIGHMSGFTLVELLIVIFVMALIASVSGDVVISTLRSSNKANIINEINQNANFVLSTVESVARNGKCAYLETGNLKIIDQYNQTNVFSFGNGAACGGAGSASCVLKSVNGATASSLTNINPQTGVFVVTSASSFNVLPTGSTCSTKNPIINVTLTLQQAPNAPTRADYRSATTFTKSIEIRNY